MFVCKFTVIMNLARVSETLTDQHCSHLRMSISSLSAWASCARLVSSSLRCSRSATSRSSISPRTHMSSLLVSSLRCTWQGNWMDWSSSIKLYYFNCWLFCTYNSPPGAAPSDFAGAAASCWWWQWSPESRDDSASPSGSGSQPVGMPSPPEPLIAVEEDRDKTDPVNRGVRTKVMECWEKWERLTAKNLQLQGREKRSWCFRKVLAANLHITYQGNLHNNWHLSENKHKEVKV